MPKGKKCSYTLGNPPKDFHAEVTIWAQGEPWELFYRNNKRGWMNLKLIYAGDSPMGRGAGKRPKMNFWLSFAPEKGRWAKHGDYALVMQDPLLGPDVAAEIERICYAWAQGQTFDRAQTVQSLQDSSDNQGLPADLL